MERDPLVLAAYLRRLVVEDEAGVLRELLLGPIEDVLEILEALVLAVESEPKLEVVDVERQALPLAGVARGVEHLEEPHAVEALEAEQLVRGDDAEVTSQLQEVGLELLVDLQLYARHLILAIATVLVTRLGHPLEHHPVPVGLLHLYRLLEQLPCGLLDTRVDALASDVEQLRELPGRDPDGL